MLCNKSLQGIQSDSICLPKEELCVMSPTFLGVAEHLLLMEVITDSKNYKIIELYNREYIELYH